ncbi:MAG: restriction endonuclease subunit S [Candidatus Eremiobacterota bacterium]
MLDENRLPQGWVTLPITKVCSNLRGVTYSKNEVSNYPQNNFIPILRANNIDEFKLTFQDLVYVINKRVAEHQKIKKYDVLVAMSSGSKKVVGKTAQCLYHWNGSFGAFCGLLRPDQSIINPKYFGYFFCTTSYRNLISEMASGTNINNLKNEHFTKIYIPMPPILEQRRIVSKLEKLLSKVESCKDRLKKIPLILKRFRQSVLASACSGRLTADWREKNPDVEPADKFLDRIKQDKKYLYDMLCEKAKLENKKKPAMFRENTEAINSNEIDIPDTWTWNRLVNISHIQGGVTKGRHFGNKKTIMLPYLRVANVQDGFLDLSEIKEIEVLPEDKEKYKLQNGDILFTEGGDRDKLGRGTIWRDNIQNCIHQNHIFRARVYSDSISPDYISLATKSDYARTYFFENASQTVNLASINMTTIGNVPIALPPLEEQQEIVRRVESLFKLADSIEARYEKAKKYIEKLSQSILSKAFRGELVPQDSSDEPASVLLELIRKDRAGEMPKNKKQ